MIHKCYVCDWSIEDIFPEIPYDEMTKNIREFHKYTANTVCPKCGAVAGPMHFNQEGENEMWLKLFSKCKNAHLCWEAETYRAEGEQLVFYPGCLSFLWRQLYEINLGLRCTHNLTDDDLYEPAVGKDL